MKLSKVASYIKSDAFRYGIMGGVNYSKSVYCIWKTRGLDIASGCVYVRVCVLQNGSSQLEQWQSYACPLFHTGLAFRFHQAPR